MNDGNRVGGGQRRSRLARVLQCLTHRKAPQAAQASRQALAFEKLHHHIGHALGQEADVDDIDDVRMMDGVGRARFVQKSLDQLRVGGQLRFENLHRSLAAKQRVLRQIHRPPCRPHREGA